MPGSRTRARGRRARLAAILDRIEHAQTFVQLVAAIEHLELFLRGIAASGCQVWPLLAQIEKCYPAGKHGEEEQLVTRAMIADIVNPCLTGNASRSAACRLKRAKFIDTEVHQ